MKKFKTIDLFISIALIAGFTVASLVSLDYTFLIGYFVVGAWQLISMGVHIYNRCFTIKGGCRYYYHWIVATIIVVSIITSAVPVVRLYLSLLPLLLAAPLMAVFYTWMCYDEVYVKMQRPLAVLK